MRIARLAVLMALLVRGAQAQDLAILDATVYASPDAGAGGAVRRGGSEGPDAPGKNADLTILGADPAIGGAAAFTQVRYAIRNGRIL